jgi:enamine deaminase RidA (YjgF/YER057c/UK114 family)
MERVRSGSPYEPKYGFCRALRTGNRVEVAGTAPIPQDGSIPPEDAYAQMLLCGEIALDSLRKLGAGPADVVRTRMFITDAAYADEVGRAHAVLFGAESPVATMVVVAALLDERWKVEIEVEAQIGG